VIANGRDAATSGRWDGRQLTGQIDPKRSLAAVKLSKLLGRDLILTPVPVAGSPGAPV